MTRVNSAIQPEVLCDQHLLAEYREMLRLISHSFKHKSDPKTKIPSTFTLGTGHVMFFLNKGKFLLTRHKQICDELAKRGYQTTLSYSNHADTYHNEYSTTMPEFNTLVERITLRMPPLPKYYKQPVTQQFMIDKLKTSEIYK